MWIDGPVYLVYRDAPASELLGLYADITDAIEKVYELLGPVKFERVTEGHLRFGITNILRMGIE